MSSSLNLSNNEIGFFNDIYMLQNTGQTSIFNIFGSKTELSSLGGLSTTTLTQISTAITSFSTLNSALATKATTTGVSDLNTALTTKAPLASPSFTGNMGINLINTDTLDSALFVKGQRTDNPSTEGMRFGWSYGVNPIGRSYGIELCSDALATSTIDFTYPNGSSSYYAGRILFDNNQGVMYFYSNTTPSTDSGFMYLLISLKHA